MTNEDRIVKNVENAIKELERAKQYMSTYREPQQHLINAAQDTLRVIGTIGVVAICLLELLKKEKPE